MSSFFSAALGGNSSGEGGIVRNMFENWKAERMKSLKSWSQFCDRSKFGMPRVPDVAARMKSNISYFQTNYVVVFFLLAIYSILTNPLFLIAVIGSISLWMYLLRWRKEPLKIGSYTVTENQKMIFVGTVTLVVFWLASVGNTIFWLLGATLSVVLLHSLFYTPVEETDFDFNTGFTDNQQMSSAV